MPKVLVNVDARGVAIGGHDPISYIDGTPALGTDQFTSKHGGATYRFATTEHKLKFDAEPDGRAPRYGGYCAFAASQNRVTPGDPQVWRIIDGQLLLFANADFRDQFEKDPAANRRKADENWPGLVARYGKLQ